MKKILGFVVLSLFAISASAADLMASSTAPTVTQNIVVEGAACPGVGATGFSSTGLLLSCQSGRWKSASMIDPGPRLALAFNTNYCLGFNALVYAQIRGDVRDSMGVEIVVNGTQEVASKADSEGWYSFESASTILTSTDCFIIRTITASSKLPIAWYRRL